MKDKIKARLIHILGGYTQLEYDKLRFAPTPVIKEKTVYPVTVTEHYTLAKIFWDSFTEKHLLQAQIRKELTTKLVPELSKLVRSTGPTYISPGSYGFSVSITVIPPLDYAEGECLSE